MRLNLKVSFAEKDEAKKLGARWDAAQKIWYVEGMADMAPFAKWSPTPQPSPAAGEPLAKSVPARYEVVSGLRRVPHLRQDSTTSVCPRC
jgi:hypothetical protein